ncbi:MAG: DEAD/DEAH box helicase [Planctomycetes bacterium]|nr:DEAD/DEAH box helicase [Planctomycetota bacterium]
MTTLDAEPLAAFHPTLAAWFQERLGAPSAPQRLGWPAIATGEHTLIAAPTGTGKTLAAFLCALDRLLHQGDALEDRTAVLYVSPLKALGNDVQKNLLAPLAELRERDPSLPDVRVLVRSGDTPQPERQRMLRTPPHVLVTTPESLYVLLTSRGGLDLLAGVGTVIVDEIHALCPDKRGSHLALSLERLAAHCGEFQRIGLSATQKPLHRVAEFLVGDGRTCRVVDAGHMRELDLRIEVPRVPLSAVCSEDHWNDIQEHVVAMIREHRTTLVFTNTRKLAERFARRLADVLGDRHVTSHHGSLSRERRLDAEQRLKRGELKALVATASLELGIDIGDVDLVVQLGATASIAQLLQRVGRAGHGAGRLPKGRVFPLTIDELLTVSATCDAIRRGELDALRVPRAPLDILAQQIVAACVQRTWRTDELFECLRRAAPYRELSRADFDAVVALHAGGRLALLHRDGVGDRLLQTKRARLPAITGGGAIPDTAQYEVVLDPDGVRVGAVDEDFAIESTLGDVFQLGNASWRVEKIEPGRLRVSDARGVPPSMPFWFGEAPARSAELCAALDRVREHGESQPWLRERLAPCDNAVVEQVAEYLVNAREDLGCVPTRRRLVLERFLDESGGAQLVLHAPFGMRINRAFGLALRKRFCRGFGFELQAAANEEAIVLSLGPMHSFPLDEVFDYLHPETARGVLVQAVLATPMFQTRWRWNVSRALVVPRQSGGRRVPAQLLRMRADDALAAAFPEVVACGENLPPGDLPVPMDHPLVRQTIDDCLTEAMDVEGFLAVLRGLRDGSIERVAVDRPTPSRLCASILNAKPYQFLDDAPLEERRTQAVISRRGGGAELHGELGALDPDAIARVREQAWPAPVDAEELHEALTWMGFASTAEVERSGWQAFADELVAACRAQWEGGRLFAVEAPRDPVAVWRGRLEALGPTIVDEADRSALLALQAEGVALQVRFDGRDGWCHRRLLARIHRETVERLRAAIQPVTQAAYERFVEHWQHTAPGTLLEGPAGVAQVVEQLSGLAFPAPGWEGELRRRLAKYRSHWIDQLTVSGEIAWLRLWGSGAAAGGGSLRRTPLSLVPRQHLDGWLAWRDAPATSDLGGPATALLDLLRARGALFPLDVQRQARLLPSQFEEALAELIARGLATVDSFAALRALTVAPSRRHPDALGFGIGRIALLPEPASTPDVDFALDRLLARRGVLFHAAIRDEPCGAPWRLLLRAARARELAGTLRGGYFVAGVRGEQFALPEAIPALRAQR